MWRLLTLFAALAISAAAYLNRLKKPTVAESRGSGVSVMPELGAFIEVVNSVNDAEDPRYLKAIEGLRGKSREVVQNASVVLSDTSDAPFALRHSTILALAAMRDGDTLDLLSRIALNPQPLPPKERGRGIAEDAFNHGSKALEAGTVLSLDALEAIEQLADDGNEKATELLVRAAAVDSNAVRAVAFAALRARPDRQDQLARALAELPEELGFLADYRRTPIDQVPQVEDPREQLADDSIALPAAPPLEAEAAQGDREDEPEHGAPTVHRR